MDKGFFGDMFDFNRDGKLDSFESAADFAAFVNMMGENDDDDDDEYEDEYEDDGDF